jgi:hypothetical protein
MMRTLHVVPGDSAGGSLKEAVRTSRPDDDVLAFLDDLSCGPIDSDEPSAREAWWRQFGEDRDVEAFLRKFWGRVTSTDERLVVWFARHSALELAFFLAWTDRLGDRPYETIDLTGRRFPYRKQDGSANLTEPTRSIGIVQPEALASLFGQESPIALEERDKCRRDWQRLRSENAPFRIVTEAGLASAAADYFDPLLLAHSTSEWQRMIRLVGSAMAYGSEPYLQTGDVMLRSRVVALVDEGRLIADGDPRDFRSTRVRLPADRPR